MQQMPSQNREFAGEQPIRRFPQNQQFAPEYQHQGRSVQPIGTQPVQQEPPASSGKKRPFSKKKGKTTVLLSPELQSAMCEQCPLKKAYEKKNRSGVSVKFSVTWIVLGIIGLITVVIQACRYVIFPLMSYVVDLLDKGGML